MPTLLAPILKALDAILPTAEKALPNGGRSFLNGHLYFYAFMFSRDLSHNFYCFSNKNMYIYKDSMNASSKKFYLIV